MTNRDASLDPFALRSLYRRQEVLRKRLARMRGHPKPDHRRSSFDRRISPGPLSLAEILHAGKKFEWEPRPIAQGAWHREGRRGDRRPRPKGTWRSDDWRDGPLFQEYMRNSMHLSQPFWWRLHGTHGRKPLEHPMGSATTPYEEAHRARTEWHRTIKVEEKRRYDCIFGEDEFADTVPDPEFADQDPADLEFM